MGTAVSSQSSQESWKTVGACSTGSNTTIRLIGRMRSEHLGELTQTKGSVTEVTLDLNEVSLVGGLAAFLHR